MSNVGYPTQQQQQLPYTIPPPCSALYPSNQLVPYTSQPTNYPNKTASYPVPGQSAPYPTQLVTNLTGPQATN